MPRVVITGVGLRIPGASSLDELTSLYRQGKAATAPLAGPLKGWAGGLVNGVENDSKLDRATSLALAAASDAVIMAGLSPANLKDAGVYTGIGAGGMSALEPSIIELYQAGTIKSNTLPRTMANATASHISIAHGCEGPCMTYAMACSSSAHSVGEAYFAVKSGRYDVAIAGGAEAVMTFGVHRSWQALRLLAQGENAVCRPFCYERQGLLLGEGAVFFVLEALDSAIARQAEALAEITGYGARADASHITAPKTEGQVATMSASLKGLDIQHIGHISAHGTATMAGDISETRAIKAVFGDRSHHLPVTASKSFHGHLLGAAGAVSLLSSLLAVRFGLIVPTINFGSADPELDLDYVPNTARENVAVQASLCNAFGFGGSNASLVLARV